MSVLEAPSQTINTNGLHSGPRSGECGRQGGSARSAKSKRESGWRKSVSAVLRNSDRLSRARSRLWKLWKDGDFDAKGITDNATHFGANEGSLLRAAPAVSILHNGGTVFSKSSGTSDDFSLSRPVPMERKIDYFISHNWLMPRNIKFLALCCHFNLRSACVASALCALTCFWLHANSMLPFRTSASTYTDSHVGIFAHVLSVPVGLFVLTLRHEGLKFISSGPLCFLDKTCISQSDPEVKQQCIMKLGAFLNSSNHILVLYSDMYLQKLWTIYEVACFSIQHRARDIKIVHTTHLIVDFVSCILFYVVVSIFYLRALFPLPVLELYVCIAWLLTLLYAAGARQSCRSRCATWRRLENFDVREALCFDENDRPLVEKNIAAFMIHKKYAGESANLNEALTAFNRLVRNFVLQLMKVSLARTYSYLIGVLLVANFTQALDVASGILADRGRFDFKVWGYILANVTLNVAFIPIGTRVCDWLMSRLEDLSGWRDKSWVLFGGLVFVMIALSLERLNFQLLVIAETSSNGPLFVAFNLVFIIGAIAISYDQHNKRNRIRDKLDELTPAERVGGGESTRGSSLLRTTAEAEDGKTTEDVDSKEAASGPDSKIEQTSSLTTSMEMAQFDEVPEERLEIDREPLPSCEGIWFPLSL